jgi:hypothetical protein
MPWVLLSELAQVSTLQSALSAHYLPLLELWMGLLSLVQVSTQQSALLARYSPLLALRMEL